jgi:hypothetical protein
MDTDEKYETPGVEIKDFITDHKSIAQGIMVTCFRSPYFPSFVEVTQKTHHGCMQTKWVHLQGRNIELRDSLPL